MDELLAEMKTTLTTTVSMSWPWAQEINTELPVIPLFYDTSNLIYNQEQITGYEDFSDHLDLSHLSWVNGSNCYTAPKLPARLFKEEFH
ncbi:MAG: hypothetical protein ACLRIS_22545 [Flavonifractor plautii]